jgi:hypothetical protein
MRDLQAVDARFLHQYHLYDILISIHAGIDLCISR